MAQRIGSEEESKRRVGTMFPKERLTRLKASRTVLSMTPKDLRDMEKAFGFRPEKVDNKKVQTLTTEDLVTLESLFGDYRMEIVANFQGVSKIDTLRDALEVGDDFHAVIAKQ